MSADTQRILSDSADSASSLSQNGARYFGGLRGEDMKRIVRLQCRLQAGNATETIRRISITVEALLDHQDTGGEIVFCRQGVADKVVWLV